MSWNYRILKRTHANTGEVSYAIHEVFYDKGKENGWTQEPVTFVGDTPEEVIRSLEVALDDARKHPVLEDE